MVAAAQVVTLVEMRTVVVVVRAAVLLSGKAISQVVAAVSFVVQVQALELVLEP